MGRHVSELLGEPATGTRGICAVHFGQQDRAGGLFDQNATADPLRAKSPFQWLDTARVATSGGRSVIGVMLAIWPQQSMSQDACGGAARQSPPESSPPSDVSVHTDTTTGRGVSEVTVGNEVGCPRGAGPYKQNTAAHGRLSHPSWLKVREARLDARATNFLSTK